MSSPLEEMLVKLSVGPNLEESSLAKILCQYAYSVSEETRGRRDGVRMTLQNLLMNESFLYSVQFGLLHCD